VTTFAGDGTGIGVSGRLAGPDALEELDRAFVDCGPLPPAREPVPATPMPEPTPVLTAAPDSAGAVAASDRLPAPSPGPVVRCEAPGVRGLVDVISTPAGPYLVAHPASPDASTPTVIFLPGGGGSYGAAQRVWETFFSGGVGFEAYRVVIPYSVDGELMSEAMRTFGILDEALACYGGDPMRVHLAGASNGGLAAFGLMTRAPERFATLLGAPGAFPVQDPSSVEPDIWLGLLAGRAVFNGVGAFDADWREEVMATHNALAAAGVESSYIEFDGQGHIPGPHFDSQVLLEFWDARE
jgi:pimeloyl-ACP methyl ester carboxylesterase